VDGIKTVTVITGRVMDNKAVDTISKTAGVVRVLEVRTITITAEATMEAVPEIWDNTGAIITSTVIAI